VSINLQLSLEQKSICDIGVIRSVLKLYQLSSVLFLSFDFLTDFEQEKDISDSKVLEAAASEIGLKDAKEFLATDKLKDEVVADVDEVRQMGISGVPAFIINGEELLSGAQETKTWVDILIERGYIQKK